MRYRSEVLLDPLIQITACCMFVVLGEFERAAQGFTHRGLNMMPSAVGWIDRRIAGVGGFVCPN